MGNIYYWIGAVIFWTVITSLTGTVLYLTWRWFKDNIWHRTWLFQCYDYWYTCKYKFCRKPQKGITGSNLYGLELKYRYGTAFKHRLFRTKFIEKVIPKILELNPNILEGYEQEKKDSKKYCENSLKESGWIPFDNDMWGKEVDGIERILFLYDAYVFQLEIDKKINKVKN